MPKVSIIIPVYNNEKYLSKCLESMLAQTLEDIEIICIDDASVDSSLNILKSFAQKDNRIKIITQNKNKGQAVARNLGIKAATGTYIAFADSDDWVLPQCYEKMYTQAEKLHSEIVICGIKRVYEGTNKSYIVQLFRKALSFSEICTVKPEQGININKDYVYDTLMVSPCYSWHRLFLRSFIIENDFYFPNLRCYEDVEFVVKTHLTANNISYIEEPLYIYNMNNNSTLNNGNNSNCIIAKVYSDVQKYLKSKGLEDRFSLNLKYFLVINTICACDRLPQKYHKKLYNKAKHFLSKEEQMYIKDKMKLNSTVITVLQKYFYIKNSKDKRHKIINILCFRIKIKNHNINENPKSKTYKILGLNLNLKLDKTGKRHVLNILGIKFKFKSQEYKQLLKTFNYYKNNNIDITTYPKATGNIRKFQMANFSLLLFLDKLCKENDIKYWLDFGSLLGAVRHKGFIPWDDDIDVSMMRDDYERIIDIVNNNKYNSDIYAELHRHPNGIPCNGKWLLTKIRHKKCPNLFVDIFPYDYLGKKLSHEEQLLYTKMIRTLKYEIHQDIDCETESSIIKNKLNQAREHIIRCHDVADQESDLIWGFDYRHLWKNWIYPHDVIFPLKDIEFEGHAFNCINNKEYFLNEVYGDYMTYPDSLDKIHDLFKGLSDEENQVIEKLIKDAGLTL